MSISVTSVGDGVEDRPERIALSIKAQRTIAQIERDLGGREVILAELLRAPKLDPPIKQLLELLYDPRFDQHPLSLLCEKVGITAGDLFAAFRDATIATAHIHAVRLVAARLPTVIAHLVEQAETHKAPCPVCEGTKVEGSVCARCKDRGTITVMADPDQQKVVLEMMGLLKKGVGFQVTDNSTTINNTQNNQLNGGSGGASLFDLQKAVGSVLHRQGLRLAPKPVEEEPLPAGVTAVDGQVEVVGE